MSTREVFEAWWVRDVPADLKQSVLARQRRGDGYLEGLQIKDAWEAWQAALAAHPSGVPEGAEPIGEASHMPGASGFTMVCFPAANVPVGTRVYAYLPRSVTREAATVPTSTLMKERRASLEWAIESAATRGYTADADVLRGLLADMLSAAPASAADDNPEAPDTDFLCIDSFAEAMKQKMLAARNKGRHGWQDCDPDDVSRMLREHVEKGDPCDVANFCMMLWHLDAPISKAATVPLTDELIIEVGKRHFREGHSPDAVTNFVAAVRDVLSTTNSVTRELLETLQMMVKHFTQTPSSLADSQVRGKAHEVIATAYAAIGYGAAQPSQAQAAEAVIYGYVPANQNGNYFTRNKSTAEYVGGMMPCYAAPPASTVASSEREGFEACLKAGTFDIDRVSDFSNCETEAAWRGWQARALLAKQPTVAVLPRVHGVSRVADNPCALLLLLMREPTDDDLRNIHDALRILSTGEAQS